jgi:hypothetical protein
VQSYSRKTWWVRVAWIAFEFFAYRLNGRADMFEDAPRVGTALVMAKYAV